MCVGKVVEALLPRSPLLPKVPKDGFDVTFSSVASPQTKELSHQPLKSHQGILVSGLQGKEEFQQQWWDGRLNLVIMV